MLFGILLIFIVPLVSAKSVFQNSASKVGLEEPRPTLLQTEIKIVNLIDSPIKVTIIQQSNSEVFNYSLLTQETTGFFKVEVVQAPETLQNYYFKIYVNTTTVFQINYTLLHPVGTDLIVIYPTPLQQQSELKQAAISLERISTMSKLTNMVTKSPYQKNYVFSYNQLPMNQEKQFDYFLRTDNCHNCSYQQLKYNNDFFFNDNSVGKKSLKVISSTSSGKNPEVVQIDQLEFGSRGVYAILFVDAYQKYTVLTVVEPESYYTPIIIAVIYFLVVWLGRKLYVKYYDKIEADQYYTVKKNIQNSSAMNEYVVEERIVEVDILRGLFILLFIVVNSGGGGYIFLNESVWDGMKLGDLPEFGIGWVLGFSIPFLVKYKSKIYQNHSSFTKFIMIKCLLFCIFGFSYNGNFDLSHFIYTGFFQRLGVALLINTLIVFYFPFVRQDSERAIPQIQRLVFRSLIMLVFPIANGLLTMFLPVEGCKPGYLRPGGIESGSYFANCTGGASRLVDIKLFGVDSLRRNPTCAAIYQCAPFDKYGALGTLNFVFGVYLATLVGEGFIKFKAKKTRAIYIMGFCLFYLSLITASIVSMGEYFLIPINRSLYSISFVLMGSLVVNIAFLLLIYLRAKVIKFSGWPFMQVGYNGLAILFMQEVCKDILPFGFLNNGNHKDLILCALMNVTIWIIFGLTLHNYKFYIKI